VGGFGQQRPQCDQSALRRFVGDGGAAVGPLKGSARAIGRSLRTMCVLMIKLCVILSPPPGLPATVVALRFKTTTLFVTSTFHG
jgi:hypothetical protein